MDLSETFLPVSYAAARARFRANSDRIRALWPTTRWHAHSHPGGDDLSTDCLIAEPLAAREKLFVLSTGLHGIEGYVGAAMVDLFVREYLPQLNAQNTGLLLVHAINPWGMQLWKRTNPNNVDLNRNFVQGDFGALAGFNPDYPLMTGFLNPQRAVGRILRERINFFFQSLRMLARFGVRRVREAALMGQYQMPGGIYFGGAAHQPETLAMMDLYRQHFAGYAQIVHLDMHTGYGPRDQMTLVTSPLTQMTAAEIMRRYGLPRVAAANPDEFYTMQGDMLDWEYALMGREYPGTRFFGAAFEFGTFGISLWAGIRSLQITVLKNRANLFGARSQAAAAWVEQEYRELYCPAEPAWLVKALADARQGFTAVLTGEGFLGMR